MVRRFTISSCLAADQSTVWRHAVTPAGVNSEFKPFLRMTFPAEFVEITGWWEPGKRVCRSWILFLGILPVEYDDIVIEEVDPGRRFLERSSMLTQRVWEHERSIDPCEGGCRLTDRISFMPRLTGSGLMFQWLFRVVFRWRHRNLRRLYGPLVQAET